MTDIGATLFGQTPGDRLNAVMQALQGNDTPRAIALAEEGLAAGQEHVLFLNLSAYRLEEAGDLNGALAQLRRALVLAPNDIMILTATGRTLSQLGRDTEALTCFDAAVSNEPRHAPAHHGRGLSQTMLGQTDDGRRSHMRAADLDPNYPDPLGSLADIALRCLKRRLSRVVFNHLHTDHNNRQKPCHPAAA